VTLEQSSATVIFVPGKNYWVSVFHISNFRKFYVYLDIFVALSSAL
jgi:hypothetical protein